MRPNELLDLKTRTGETCISIIIPTYHKGTETKENSALVKKAVAEAETLLSNYEGEKLLKRKLEELTQEIDYKHPSQGLGLFLSESTKKIFNFHFPVKRLVDVGESFEIRDVLFDVKESEPYGVLTLTRKEVHAYMGTGGKLAEVLEKPFPKKFHDSYEYPRPLLGSPGSYSLKGSEEKSVTKDNRIKTFFNSVDHVLDSYFGQELPLIVMGSKENLSAFRSLTKHSKQIVSYVPGNYENGEPAKLAEMALTQLQAYHSYQAAEALKNLETQISYGLAVSGLQAIWRVANVGNVLTLLVEKNFRKGAYRSQDGTYLSESRNIDSDIRLIDVIDDIIEKVLDKGGNIQFVEDGSLDQYGHMIAIQRYI
jgi:hypothetical protein